MYVCVSLLVTKYMEVRVQLEGFGSLLSCSGDQTYVVRLENKHLYTLKHCPTPNWVIWQIYLSIIHFKISRFMLVLIVLVLCDYGCMQICSKAQLPQLSGKYNCLQWDITSFHYETKLWKHTKTTTTEATTAT